MSLGIPTMVGLCLHRDSDYRRDSGLIDDLATEVVHVGACLASRAWGAMKSNLSTFLFSAIGPVKLTWNGLQFCYFAAWVGTIASICMSFAAVLIAQDVVAVAGPCGASMQRFSEIALKREKIRARIGNLIDDPSSWRRQLTSITSDMIAAGRVHLGDCSREDSPGDHAFVLGEIGSGLLYQGEDEDAVPVLKRCLALNQEDDSCWMNLGDAYRALCRFDDAKQAYSKVIEIGGFTTATANFVKAAKIALSLLSDPKSLAYERSDHSCPIDQKDSNNLRYGTGFFVSKQGHILTNDHVVEGCKELKTTGGKTLIVVDRRPSADLALLQAEFMPSKIATFRSGTPPKLGDAVFTFGFPLPGILSSEGNVSAGMISAVTGIKNDVSMLQISAPLQPGNSGGPLMDSSGNVIGVIVAKLDALEIARLTGDVPQNVNFAIQWAEVKAFLHAESVAYVEVPSVRSYEASSVAERAKSFTVAIECRQ